MVDFIGQRHDPVGAPRVPVEIMPLDLLMGRTLKGTSLGGAKCRTDLPRLVEQLMEKRFGLGSRITHKLPLERINEGYDMMMRDEGIRSVVVF